ncbi:MAG: class I SAM-dependent methyltransferase [candidate division NC10 bacterium]|nr:class I SAM-dependent methyltransferase [candidate division NC10 bacterium]
MVDLLHMDLAGKPIPGITEEVRLANIRKLASTPFLKNPYQLAVGAIFEEIQDREQARVLDVGVGSGAQMVELLGLLQREPHRLRRLEVVGLDFVQQFLETAGRNILARAQELAGRVAVSYRPVQGRIEALDGATLRAITSDGPLDAANASIALHEVPGEAKWAALRNLRALAPMRFVLVEWNYCLENVLPETTAEFLFNVRRVAAAMVAVLREQHPVAEAREVVRGWLTQAGGQLTCPAAQRQECFLDAASWKALLEVSGFTLRPPDPNLLKYVERPDRAGTGPEPWYLAALPARKRMHTFASTLLSRAVSLLYVRQQGGSADGNNLPKHSCWWIPQAPPDAVPCSQGATEGPSRRFYAGLRSLFTFLHTLPIIGRQVGLALALVLLMAAAAEAEHAGGHCRPVEAPADFPSGFPTGTSRG